MENKDSIEKFIKEELDNIPVIHIIHLPFDDNTMETLNTATEEISKICKDLISSNGTLRNIIKQIKANKLNKKKTNTEIKKIANKIKKNIELKTDIENDNVKFLINNRINQILKYIIHNIIE